jgi:hypothetical protein
MGLLNYKITTSTQGAFPSTPFYIREIQSMERGLLHGTNLIYNNLFYDVIFAFMLVLPHM